jgi:acid phosphatase type 7
VSNVGARVVTSALLNLRVASITNAESLGSGGQIHRITNCAWPETTTNWNNQPAIDGPVLQTLGAVAQSQAVSFNVTSAVPGDGTYCFAIDSLSTDGVDYNSREASTGKPTMTVTVAP